MDHHQYFSRTTYKAEHWPSPYISRATDLLRLPSNDSQQPLTGYLSIVGVLGAGRLGRPTLRFPVRGLLKWILCSQYVFVIKDEQVVLSTITPAETLTSLQLSTYIMIIIVYVFKTL